MAFLAIVTVISFLLFYVVYKHNHNTIFNGFSFSIFLLFFSLFFLAIVLQYGNILLLIPFFMIALFILLCMLFGVYGLIIFLILNAKTVFKKERFRLSNSLTLILSILLILFLIIYNTMSNVNNLYWLTTIWTAILSAVWVYLMHIIFFILSLLLSNLSHPPKKTDYVIILGSGLINGQVSPLLAGRIQRAIQFYNKQENANKAPKLIFSGGQGEDEPIAEGVAMQQYALKEGIPEENTLVEKESINTYQNMMYSKNIMEQDHGSGDYQCVYVTSNYHLLRAGIYANKAGLNIVGLGSKTASYYLPNALIREYIALFWMHKKFNIFLIGLIILFMILLNYLPDLLLMLKDLLMK